MSGIAGLVDAQAPRVDVVLRAMLDAIVHRGPDGEGVYVDGGVALGMRRLCVIDVAQGWQPLAARGGRVLAFKDGEIYNYGELRAELGREGVRFATASDTEVLAQGYDRWGIEKLLKRVDGMYAMAILDRDARVLHVARDRFGEKPLLYACAQNRFAFGSDAGMLAALPWVDSSFDPLSLRRYLALQYVPGDASIYRGVARVLPGERLVVALDDPRPQRERYFIPPLPAVRSTDDGALATLLERAVASRLIADVPAGVLLSGGLDSSLIAAIAARHRPGVLTFSLGIRADDEDATYARDLATAIGSTHHHFALDDASFETLVPAIAAALDEPLGDPALLPMYWLAREARMYATVALAGEGADETFAGHDHYRAFASKPGLLHAIRSRFGKSLERSREIGTSIVDRLSAQTPSGRPLLTDSATRARLVPVDASASDLWERDVLAWLLGANDSLQRASAADLATAVADNALARIDRMAMAVSLEGRSPFLAPDLVEAALALPLAQRMNGDASKVALRRIAARWLPERIHARRRQRVALPLRDWLQRWFAARGGADRYFREHSISMLDGEAIAGLVADDIAAGLHRERLLFALVMLVEWNAAQQERLAALRSRYDGGA
jgi:asparagine synthase (glutamine-hydrolysing)